MTQKNALHRYLKVFIPATVIYVVSVLGVSWASDFSLLPMGVMYFLTLIPILAVFTWIWAQWRFVLEIDEYQRSIQLKAMMFGATAVLAIASGWGLLEFFTDIPRIPIFFALPGFYLFYGTASALIVRRERVQHTNT